MPKKSPFGWVVRVRIADGDPFFLKYKNSAHAHVFDDRKKAKASLALVSGRHPSIANNPKFIVPASEQQMDDFVSAVIEWEQSDCPRW